MARKLRNVDGEEEAEDDLYSTPELRAGPSKRVHSATPPRDDSGAFMHKGRRMNNAGSVDEEVRSDDSMSVISGDAGDVRLNHVECKHQFTDIHHKGKDICTYCGKLADFNCVNCVDNACKSCKNHCGRVDVPHPVVPATSEHSSVASVKEPKTQPIMGEGEVEEILQRGKEQLEKLSNDYLAAVKLVSSKMVAELAVGGVLLDVVRKTKVVEVALSQSSQVVHLLKVLKGKSAGALTPSGPVAKGLTDEHGRRRFHGECNPK